MTAPEPKPDEMPDMGPLVRMLEGMHRMTIGLDQYAERMRMTTALNQVERDVRLTRARTAAERAAVAVKFSDLRPDGRPTFDAAYLAVAQVVGMMGDCSRDHIGAVAVREDVPLAWGYNGTNPGVPGCLAGACPRAAQDVPQGSDYHNCIARHAEINLIGFAAHHGIALAGSTVYVSREPCAGCQKALYAVAVEEVRFPKPLTTQTES